MGADFDSEFAAPPDVTWDRLNKARFFGYGALLFSGVTLALYPLSVIKTRQIMFSSSEYSAAQLSGMRGMSRTAAFIQNEFGFRGFYKGLGTVLVGALPARLIYLNTLEFVRFMGNNYFDLNSLQGSPGIAAKYTAISSFAAGAVASLATQTVTVPMDVVSQRLIVQKKSDTRYANGLQLAMWIVRNEGFRQGLYRGYFLSIATFVPSSAIWWGSYGAYKRLLFEAASKLDLIPSSKSDTGATTSEAPERMLSAKAASMQILAALGAGITSSILTTPLDVLKVRMQVQETLPGVSRPGVVRTFRTLIKEDGFGGLFRGVLPRMVNVSIWGTCMVSAYELLKQLSKMPDPAALS